MFATVIFEGEVSGGGHYSPDAMSYTRFTRSGVPWLSHLSSFSRPQRSGRRVEDARTVVDVSYLSYVIEGTTGRLAGPVMSFQL